MTTTRKPSLTGNLPKPVIAAELVNIHAAIHIWHFRTHHAGWTAVFFTDAAHKVRTQPALICWN